MDEWDPFLRDLVVTTWYRATNTAPYAYIVSEIIEGELRAHKRRQKPTEDWD